MNVKQRVLASLDDLQDIFDQPTLQKVRGTAEQILSDVFDVLCFQESVLNCVEKYVASEMDFETHGKRGLGRLSEVIPRFGAAFHRDLRKLSSVALKDVGRVLTETVYSGYTMWVCLMEVSNGEIAERKTIDSEVLFRKWVPTIYSSALGEQLTNVLVYVASKKVAGYVDKFDGLGIAKKGIFSDPRKCLPDVVAGHFFAGATLRGVEVM